MGIPHLGVPESVPISIFKHGTTIPPKAKENITKVDGVYSSQG